MSQILVIKIDPEAKTVTADTIENNLTSMQGMVGGNIERVYAPLGDESELLWVNGEAKFQENFHFNLKGFPDIIAGPAFICREVEVEGEDGFVNGDTQLDVAAVQALIEWLPHLDNQQLL